MMDKNVSRRRFLAALPLGAAAALTSFKPLSAVEPHPMMPGCKHHHPHQKGPAEHPAPREGVDASKVLKKAELQNPAVADLFEEIAKIPEVADGVWCYCGCQNMPNHYSLLTCYEKGGTAQWCEICQGTGRLVVRRTKEGQTLDQIRRAVDARFG